MEEEGAGLPKVGKISIGPCGGGAKNGGRRSSLNKIEQVYVIGSLGPWGGGCLQVNKFEHVRVSPQLSTDRHETDVNSDG